MAMTTEMPKRYGEGLVKHDSVPRAEAYHGVVRRCVHLSSYSFSILLQESVGIAAMGCTFFNSFFFFAEALPRTAVGLG